MRCCRTRWASTARRPKPTAQSEAAILGAAADNLTPAVMADEETPPHVDRVRELEEIDPGVLPKVDELRAQVVREQRARNRRRGWVIAAVLVVVAGAAYFLLPKHRQQAEGRHRDARRADRPHRGRRRRGKEGRRAHHATHRARQAHAPSSTRTPPRSGVARTSPPRASRSTTSAACWSAANTTPRRRRSPHSTRRSPTIEARVPAALAAQTLRGQARAHRRRIRELAPGLRNGAQDRARQQRSHRRPRQGGRRQRRAAHAGRRRKRRERRAICPRRSPCSPTCSSAIRATSRPPRDWRASGAPWPTTQFNAEMGAGLAALNAGRLAEARTHLEQGAPDAPRQRRGRTPPCSASPTPAPAAAWPSSNSAPPGSPARNAGAEALAIYDEALARDPSLQFAIDGRAAVAPRAELGKRLQALIDRPERLAEDPVRADAERLLARARALPNQGPVIRSQVSRLELLLPTFNQPVMLALESDNATEVAIQRVGFFGAFDRREVDPETRQVHGHRQAQRASATCGARSPWRPGQSRTDHRHPLPGTDLRRDASNHSDGTLAFTRRHHRPAQLAGRVALRRARGHRSGLRRDARRITSTRPSPVDAPPLASLRAVSGRWLFDAAPEGRISINGVPVAGARIVIAGDVITIAGSQLLVEEAQPRSLALRRFELEGTDTLPPVGDSVRTRGRSGRRPAVDLGEVPSVEGAAPATRGPRAPRSKLNYAAWAMGVLLLVVLGLFALLQPDRARPAARRRPGALARQFLVAVRLERVRVSRRAHACAPSATGYEPAEVQGGRRRAGAGARADPPGQTTRQARGGQRRREARRSPPTARASARVPGTVDVPAGERTLTFKAPRYLDHVERLSIAGGGEQQKLKVALKPNFARGQHQLGAGRRADRSRRQDRPASRPPRSRWIRASAACRCPRPGCASWTSSVVVTAGVPQTIGPDRARRRRRAHHRALGALRRAGDHRRQFPRRHAGHHRSRAGRLAHHHGGARRLRAVDARGVRRSRTSSRTLDARLAALLVPVRIQGEPDDAEVFVNGDSRGTGAGVARAARQPPPHRSAQGRLQAVQHRPGAGARHRAHRATSSWSIRRTWSATRRQASPPSRGIKLLIVAGGTYQAGTDRREQGRRPNEGCTRSRWCGRSTWASARSPTRSSASSSQPTTPARSATSRWISTSSRWCASPGTTPRSSATGCRQQEGLPPAYSARRRRRLHAHRAGEQRLSPAHRGRVGIRGARRRHRQAAQVSLGPGSARGLGHRQFRRQRGVRACWAARSRDTATNSPRWRRRRCSRRIAMGFYDLAGNVSEWVNDKYLSFVASAAVTDPLGPTDSKGHTYRGSNWRSASTSELRFPWREGAHAGQRCHRLPRRALRGAGLAQETISCATFSSACSRSAWPPWRP